METPSGYEVSRHKRQLLNSYIDNARAEDVAAAIEHADKNLKKIIEASIQNGEIERLGAAVYLQFIEFQKNELIAPAINSWIADSVKQASLNNDLLP